MNPPLPATGSFAQQGRAAWKGICRATCREINRIWTRRPFLVVLIFLLLALALRIGQFPRQRGDGAEYFVVTRSLARQGDLVIEPDEAEVYRQPNSPWQNVVLQWNYGPLIEGHDDRKRGIHPFIVPALVVPFYYLCSRLAPEQGAFHCYSVFGLWALLVSWYLLARFWENKADPAAGAVERWALRGLALLAISFTPILIYSHWVHPEVGVFLLLCLFFYWLDRNRPIPAAGALGLAAAQNPAVIFWGLLLVGKAYAVWRRRRVVSEQPSRLWPYVAAAVLFPFPAVAYALYSYHEFGALSVLRNYGNGYLPLLTATRVLRFYLDPFFGLIWFCPWIFLGLFARGTWRPFLTRLAVSIPVAAVCVAMINLNSHMVGLRYLLFVYPAFLFLPFSFPRRATGRLLLALYAVFCLWVGTPFVFKQKEAERFYYTINNGAYVGIRAVFRAIPALYNPEPEFFFENALHADVAYYLRNRKHAGRARVSDSCWLVYVEKQWLPAGKATLILKERGGRKNPESAPARFGINQSLSLPNHAVERRGGEYRLEFTARPENFIPSPLWGEYLYLKFNHPVLKPLELELAGGQRIAL